MDGSYIGVPGRLVALPDVQGDLATAFERPTSFQRTLGGRVVAQRSVSTRRSWPVTVGAMNATEVGSLMHTLETFDSSTVSWFTAWATETNLLTPDHSAWAGLSLSGATVGSMVDLEGGGYAVSLNDAASPTRAFSVQMPVVQGVPVSAGVFARPVSVGGSVTCRMTWVDAGGSVLSSNSASKVCVSSGPFTRVTVTATPPVGAAAVYLVATGHTALAGPTLTFTQGAYPWGAGEGCLAALVTDVQHKPIYVGASASDESLAEVSFTVTEVG